MNRYPNAAAIAALGLALAGCQKAAAPGANTVPAPAPIATNAAPAPAAAAAAAAAAATGSTDAAGAKAFMDGLYAHYKSSQNNTFDLYGRDAASVFDADTLALMQADKTTLSGEPDAVCTCQNFDGLAATVTIVSITPTTARAGVNFHDTGQTENNHSDYDLTRTPAGWRVHDIHSFGQASFRGSLNEDIKDAKFAPAS